jgi:hypothetical protein
MTQVTPCPHCRTDPHTLACPVGQAIRSLERFPHRGGGVAWEDDAPPQSTPNPRPIPETGEVK